MLMQEKSMYLMHFSFSKKQLLYWVCVFSMSYTYLVLVYTLQLLSTLCNIVYVTGLYWNVISNNFS